MYKNALPQHQGEARTSNVGQNGTTNNINYNNLPFDYGLTTGYISQEDDHVNMIHIKGVDTQCVVTTRRVCMSILGGPTSNTTPMMPVSTQYNILEHIGKTPAQISTPDLLKASPTHQVILT